MPNRIESFTGEHRFLSNFWPAPVQIMVAGATGTSRVTAPTVEHAYQALKTLDMGERRRVLEAASAGVAKRLGRTLTIRDDWEEVRVAFMLNLVRQKFEHPELAKLLLATGDAEIVEGNTWNDTFWGVCRGRGSNWLGRILMHVRTELRVGERKTLPEAAGRAA